MGTTRANFVASAVAIAAVGLLSVSTMARADIIPFGTVDVGGQGFGAFPRLLTLDTPAHSTTETGAVTVSGTGVQSGTGDLSGGPNIPTNQNGARTIGELGWTSPNSVAIGLNANQTGADLSLTVTNLVMTVYNATFGIAGTFSLKAPVTLTENDVKIQQGNGNALFEFVLDATQQGIFNTILALANSSTFLVALSATMTNANDGADSFLGIPGTATITPVPLPPALLLFGTALAGMGFLGRRRRNKTGVVQA